MSEVVARSLAFGLGVFGGRRGLGAVGRLAAAAGFVALGCGAGAAGVPSGGAAAGAGGEVALAGGGAAEAARGEGEALPWIEDDIEAAAKKAKAEGKALFVDAWAPWCHTCLSMKNYVFTDPSLAPLAERVVFAAIDTDKESSARFLERHAVQVWPMFFVIDPATDRVAGAWPGSASLAELRGFIADSLATMEAARAGGLAADDPVRLVAEARAAHAAGDPAGAAKLFERAAAKVPAGHARRSEVLVGWLFALYGAKDWKGCAAVGEAHVGEVAGAAMPADFSAYLLACADHLEGVDKARAQAAAVAKLRAFTASPPADASADDRADAWNTLAETLEEAGDAAGARKAYEAKLAILEQAAAKAATPEIAATFDYGRATTYVALGKGGYAIALLEAREREMPASYEPTARLASALYRLGRYGDAKAAVERAIAKAYGPRKLGYMKLRSDILGKMGDRAGQLAALRDEVKGYEALPAGHASPSRLADAKKRLAAAEADGPKP